MAEFLTTTGISSRLTQIIQDAKKRIVIISPYLQVNKLIKDEIDYKIRTSRDIEVWLIFREDKLRAEDREWLDKMPSIKRGLLKSLHAKCYMNENEALVTSMNLYEYSQNNNKEMGIFVSRSQDRGLYEAIQEESIKLATTSGITPQKTTEPDKISEFLDRVSGLFGGFTTQPSELEESSPSPETLEENTREEIRPSPSPAARTRKEDTQTIETPVSGFCIRCKAGLPANPTQPYCSDCYTSWKPFDTKEHKENHCHTCGEEHTTTMAKPLCRVCYRKYKDVLQFAAN